MGEASAIASNAPNEAGLDLAEDRLREHCGVFGIFNHPDAAAIVALGLHALQHRGQEAAGIVAYDGVGSTPSAARGWSAIISPTPRPSTAFRGAPRSAMCAIRPPARPSCATSSRCLPNSRPAASRSPTTAI
jgi:hypothetical protein